MISLSVAHCQHFPRLHAGLGQPNTWFKVTLDCSLSPIIADSGPVQGFHLKWPDCFALS